MEKSLRDLARGLGVQRADLVEALGGKLAPLATVLHLDASLQIEAVKELLAQKLREGIARLDFVKRNSSNRIALLVSFNLLPKHGFSDLELSARRERLNERASGRPFVPLGTTRHALDRGARELAALLVHDYAHTQQDIPVPADVTADAETDPAGEGREQSIEPLTNRIASRVAVELRAVKNLIKPALLKLGRTVKEKRGWIVCTGILTFALAFASSQLAGQAEVPWQGWQRPVMEKIPVYILIIPAIAGAALVGMLPLVKRRKRTWLVLSAVLLLLVQNGFFVSAIVAAKQELDPINRLTEVTRSWNLRHVFAFDGKSTTVNPYTDFCEQFKPDFSSKPNQQAWILLLAGREQEFDRRHCSTSGDVLALKANPVPNSVPGNWANDSSAQTVVEVLVNPVRTNWSNCRLVAVPSYQEVDKAPNILGFGLEVVEGERIEYRPTIEEFDFRGKSVVAQSVVTLPLINGGKNFAGERRQGWVTFGVHRHGGQFDFFVNDHLLASHNWGHGDLPMHISLYIRSADLADQGECRFDDFRYYLRPASEK